MPRRSGRVYRDIGLRPEHNKWLEEQAGGKRGVSKIVEACIARTMMHSDAADKVDRLQADVDVLKTTLEHAAKRLDTIAAFLEFQVWIGVGRNQPSFDAWYEEFNEFQKEPENA
jgi:hypothetical protein